MRLINRNLCFIVCASACLSVTSTFATAALALASVESRTGEPVVRGPMENSARGVQQGYQGNQSYRGNQYPSNQGYSDPGYSNSNGNGANITSSLPVEERAARLTLKEIESLQKEVSELRGMVEVQDHEIKQLKKSQQDFYMDLDRRLSQLSTSPGSKPGIGSATSQTSLTSQKAGVVGSKTAIKQTAKELSATIQKESVKDATKSAEKSKELPKGAACKGCKPKESTKESTDAALFTNEASKDKDLAATKDPTAAKDLALSKDPTAPQDPTPSKDSTASQNLTPSKESISSSSSVKNPSENSEVLLYQGAYNQVKTKRYDEALQSFQEYVNQFPKGEHVANAHYWMGEVYMVQWQGHKTNPDLLENARTEFSKIASTFPTHPKSPDAVLKLGIIALEQGDFDTAKQHLTQVKSRYPGTAAARVAETKLKQM